MTATSWRIPRESAEWVGPLAITAAGAPVTTGIKVALLPKGQRPVDADWRNPDPDPDGSGSIGVAAAPTLGPSQFGIWIRIDGLVVIEPDEIGWVFRT